MIPYENSKTTNHSYRYFYRNYGEIRGNFLRILIELSIVINFIVCGLLFSVPASAAQDAIRDYPDNLFGVAFDGDGSVIATGYHGVVKRSSDGGRLWALAESGTKDLLRRVTAVAGDVAFAVSHRGLILQTADDGATWRKVYEEPGLYLRAIDFADAANGWAVGHNGVILHTADGGKTWSTQALSDYKGRDLPRLGAVVALDAQRALVAGEFGVVAATEDAGATWRVITEQVYPTLLDLALVKDRGYAVGLNGTLLALTLSEGGGWQVRPVETGREQHLLSVALSADGKTGLIGGNGVLLTVDEKGLAPAAVSPEFPLSYSWIGGVAIAGNGRAVAVGQGGAILEAEAPAGPFKPAGSAVLQSSNETDRVQR